MITAEKIFAELNQHAGLCQELLGTVEREGQALRAVGNPSLFEFYQFRKNHLPKLNASLESLRENRVQWQKLTREERSKYPEFQALLRRTQELTMKIILLDRENEQSLLRRGLVPARELPSVNQQRPNFVADLYRRQIKA